MKTLKSILARLGLLSKAENPWLRVYLNEFNTQGRRRESVL
jgi:hypothetical protein